MKFRISILASLIAPVIYTAQAKAAEGVVVYKEYSCDYYIVNTQKGFLYNSTLVVENQT